MSHRTVICTRSQKASCLLAAADNLKAKANAKKIDPGERENFKRQVENLRDEAYRHLRASSIHGSQMTNRTTRLQATLG